ncbi:sortase B protein-sorting domain-containing protein [Bradyrhizobium sp. USDA 4532]
MESDHARILLFGRIFFTRTGAYFARKRSSFCLVAFS